MTGGYRTSEVREAAHWVVRVDERARLNLAFALGLDYDESLYLIPGAEGAWEFLESRLRMGRRG